VNARVGVAIAGMIGSGVASIGVAAGGVAGFGAATGLDDIGAGRAEIGVGVSDGVPLAPGVTGALHEASKESAASRMNRRMVTSHAM
jgi:hypothetical protein